jgi:hypothetical protein
MREIIKCPKCSDIWQNWNFTGLICHCFNCSEKYYRDDNRKIMDDFLSDYLFRVKG